MCSCVDSNAFYWKCHQNWTKMTLGREDVSWVLKLGSPCIFMLKKLGVLCAGTITGLTKVHPGWSIQFFLGGSIGVGVKWKIISILGVGELLWAFQWGWPCLFACLRRSTPQSLYKPHLVHHTPYIVECRRAQHFHSRTQQSKYYNWFILCFASGWSGPLKTGYHLKIPTILCSSRNNPEYFWKFNHACPL